MGIPKAPAAVLCSRIHRHSIYTYAWSVGHLAVSIDSIGISLGKSSTLRNSWVNRLRYKVTRQRKIFARSRYPIGYFLRLSSSSLHSIIRIVSFRPSAVSSAAQRNGQIQLEFVRHPQPRQRFSTVPVPPLPRPNLPLSLRTK